MSSRWKRIGLLTAIAAALSVAVAVSLASAMTDRAGSAGAAAATNLTIMGFGTNGDDVAKTRYALAEKAVGGGVSAPNGAFDDQQFLAAIAAGDVPDLVYFTRDKVGTYAARGALVPLTSCIKSHKINMKQYRSAAVNEVTYKKKVYAIPEFYDVRTVIANLSVLAKAKVKLSQLNTKNWATLKTAARKLYTASGGKVTRIGFDPKLPEFFPLWAKANGQDLLSKDGLHPHINSPRAVAALQYAISLINAQGGWNRFKAFRDTWDFFGKGNQVAEDQVGAWPMEQWYYNVLTSTSPNVKIAALPFRARNGKVINYETGSAWAIPKGAKHQAAACQWMKTMTSVNTWMAAARNRAAVRKQQNRPYTGLSTANAIADKAIFKQTYSPINRYFDQAVKTVLVVQQHSFYIPASPASAEINDAWMNAVNSVLTGQASVRSALNKAQAQAVSAIKNAQK
jgi:multiple sugar transport system substrate-binding protein